ncbi:MAG: peptidoglycan-binding domain-containing protein [Oscillospiraceae bacterium]|jgi:peptidoglycan hydrolase-like protein with peptidoglycan-binding domain
MSDNSINNNLEGNALTLETFEEFVKRVDKRYGVINTLSADTPAQTQATTAALPDPNLLTFPLIKRGSRGVDVEFAQDMLWLFLRPYDLSSDGIFGPITEYYVKQFQSYNGLIVDGIVGPITWAKLGPTVSTAWWDSRPWRRETIVYEVQRWLCLGGKFPNDWIDGVWGWRTENAIKDFQRIYGITVDGKWGKQCWSIRHQGWC